jgi:hypothetical protein
LTGRGVTIRKGHRHQQQEQQCLTTHRGSMMEQVKVTSDFENEATILATILTTAISDHVHMNVNVSANAQMAMSMPAVASKSKVPRSSQEEHDNNIDNDNGSTKAANDNTINDNFHFFFVNDDSLSQ